MKQVSGVREGVAGIWRIAPLVLSIHPSTMFHLKLSGSKEESVSYSGSIYSLQHHSVILMPDTRKRQKHSTLLNYITKSEINHSP